MKNNRITVIIAILTIIGFSITGCSTNKFGKDKNNNSVGTVTITVGDTRNLVSMLPDSISGSITWKSDAPEVASVAQDGTVKAIGVTDILSERYSRGYATGKAAITAAADGQSCVITVITTLAGGTDIMELPPMKEQFEKYFLFGNIFNPGNVASNGSITPRLTRHFNVLTAENNMKPQYIATSRNGNNITYNFTEADRMVNAAIASGFKVVGHTLLWHSQIPQWQKDLASTGKETALPLMKKYISEYVGHFAGRIYSWDVINEAFPDGANGGWKTSIRSENPWNRAIGSDFVYEAFLAARQADPNAILYYNDYNLVNSGKATLVRDMVHDVNAQYEKAFPNANRKLIEGIGMQSHHNTGIQTSSIRSTINLFRPLGVKLSISELDLLGQGWSSFSSIGHGPNKQDNSAVTNQGILTQAKLYGEYMKLFIENSDIIERVTFWGLLDNQSWRSGGLPLLFDSDGMAKPAYYNFVGALP